MKAGAPQPRLARPDRRAWLAAALALATGPGWAARLGSIEGWEAQADPPAVLADALRALYPSDDAALLWVDAAGRPTPNAMQALLLLSQAADDGLEVDDYGASALATQAMRLRDAEAPAQQAAVAFDLQASTAMLRFLHDLGRGRVAPSTVGFRLPGRVPPLDLAGALRDALAQGRLNWLPFRFRPPLAQYDALREALRHQRAQVGDPALRGPLPSIGAGVRPGERYAGAPALRARLFALGDLAPAFAAVSGPAAAAYDSALVDAVRRFQDRHGLQPDGVLGRATAAALDVPPEHRAHQIALALERLRWLPPPDERAQVTINIPMFRLWAADGQPGSHAPAMRVIVGRAVSGRTPPFLADMTHLILYPYWNVPRSIVRDEALPELARDPQYLARNDMEIVAGVGNEARVVPANPSNIERLARGELRLRQRPGPRNALGPVKFVLPNNDSIYLHGTPSQELFGRSRRDFSHGCVRLEDPLALAEWALRDQPHWTRERLLSAMAGPRPQRVDFTQPIHVLLFYVTAAVLPQDGALHFADDIYGYDARLERALARRARG